MLVCKCGHQTHDHSWAEGDRKCLCKGCDCDAFSKDETFPEGARAFTYLSGIERELVSDTARSLGGYVWCMKTDDGPYYIVVTSIHELIAEDANRVLIAKAPNCTQVFSEVKS